MEWDGWEDNVTPRQKNNYNLMLRTLKKIAKEYQTPNQLRRSSEKQYGVSYLEAIEMSYENIQEEASWVSRGIRPVKM